MIKVIKVENYPNAYKEIHEILKFVPKEDLDKIPTKFIEMVQKKMNKEYEFSINCNIDFLEEQKLMVETRTILAYIFLNYWATEKQKETINIKFKKDIEEAEEEKRKLYDVDVFKNKRQMERSNTEELEMIVYKKENFISKIFNKIISFFKRKS